MQQKEASIHLKVLWDSDPFKAKWTIISSAYSKIRDAVSKKKAPLDVFLSIVCPNIGILAVEEYFLKLNWTRLIDERGEIRFKQSSLPDLKQLPASILNTTMTSKDVIQLCAEGGFIQQEIADKIVKLSSLGIFKWSEFDPQGLLALAPMTNQSVKAKTPDSPIMHTKKSTTPQLDAYSPNTQVLEYDDFDTNIPNATLDFDFEKFLQAEIFHDDLPSIIDHQSIERNTKFSFGNCENIDPFAGNIFQHEQLLPEMMLEQYMQTEKLSDCDFPGFSYEMFLYDLS